MTNIRPRRRAVDVPEAPPPMAIEDQLLDVWRLKVAADNAASDYEKARKELHTRMIAENRVSVLAEGLRDRPTVEAKEMSKVMTTIDPAGFRKLVTAEQFVQCVKVGIGDAKKFATETALKAISTETRSAPYLEIRAKGKRGE